MEAMSFPGGRINGGNLPIYNTIPDKGLDSHQSRYSRLIKTLSAILFIYLLGLFYRTGNQSKEHLLNEFDVSLSSAEELSTANADAFSIKSRVESDCDDLIETSRGVKDFSSKPSSTVPLSTFPAANVPSESFYQGEEIISESHSLHKPIVISGPSGVGKGTLINKLLQFYGGGEQSEKSSDDLFGFSVSHTTRKPRPGEIEGIHYHFTSREEMMEDIESNKFIEYAEVHGNFYGTR